MSQPVNLSSSVVKCSVRTQATSGVAGPAAAPSPAAAPDLMTPAQVAQLLGVAESDVVASLDAGDLKGKRIGSQWRVTKTAVDQFLHS